ncbi:hypothetical protein [Streptosporangium sp. NPDC000396]|uniref:hypothetical protein n=1 Tax=Streptosporangium sp. NPDC000396 TaxID=3366185 RepID=UPI00369BB59B
MVAAAFGGVVQSVLPTAVRLALLGVLAVIVLLRETGLITLRVPENARLVPEHVLHRGRVLGGIQFGFEMGTGMRTYSPSSLPHLVLLALLLAVPFPGALAAGAGFALARWIMAAASVTHSDDGSWSFLWDDNKRLLAAATAASAVASLALGLLA